MGEATVHREIEFTAWDATDPRLEAPANADVTFASLSNSQRQALYAYVGNWMRDFSQVFVPVVFTSVAQMNAHVPAITSPETIGPQRAEALLTSVLRAIAILEFDEALANEMVTTANIGQYVPEEHMDNPANLRLSDVLVRVGNRYTVARPIDAGGAYVSIPPAQLAAVQAQLRGSAYAGLQIDNGALYGVGPLGLNYLIHNTSEWIKLRWGAARATSDDHQRAALIGSGLHGIEDYFAHSNFIEVAINFILDHDDEYAVPDTTRSRIVRRANDPHERWVDTLYDRGIGTVPPESTDETLVARQRRHPITTGTFSGADTQVSIAHLLLPKVEYFSDALARGAAVLSEMSIEYYLGNVPPSLSPAERQDVEDQADGLRAQHHLSDRQARAVRTLISGLDASGLKLIAIVTSGYALPTKNALETAIQNIGNPVTSNALQAAVDAIDSTYPGLFGMDLKTVGYASPSDAFESYREHAPYIRTGVDTLLWLKDYLPDPGSMLYNAAPAIVQRMIDNLHALEADTLRSFQGDLASAFRTLFYRLVEQMIGLDGVTDAERGHPDQWAERVKNHVQDLERRTFDAGTSHAGLPPSHSEICKDHPPHPGSGHATDQGSLFYDLHKRLAVAAVRHCTHQIEADLSVRVVERPAPSQAERDRFEARSRRAATLRTAVQREAGASNRRLATPPGTAGSYDLVDFYISHPEDSIWWRTIVHDYVLNESDAAVRDINRRNRTRSERP